MPTPGRGRLKIFFGAAAGVGKTHAMLQAAHALTRDGVDVVVGVIETHGWGETAALAVGLETLPLRKVEHRAAHVQELDLDAAIARRPQLILVDDLAHANAPSCRHAKRWQDVDELLAAGISVYTTLGVQHLDSLTNIVERITAVEMRETVPDQVFEKADSVELVDRAPDEILKRLHGASNQMAKMPDGFVSLNHLIALRELSLRVIAERVHQQVQAFRRNRPGVAPTVPTAERLLVCIGASPLSARLVRAARRMAGSLQAEWIAVYVETPEHRRLSDAERQHAIENIRLAELLGAETVTLSGVDLAAELIAFARLRNVTKMVIGKPFIPRWREWLQRSLVYDLVRRSGDIDLYIINGEAGEEQPAQPVRVTGPGRLDPTAYSLALAVVGVATVAGFMLQRELNPIHISMFYLLAVVGVAALGKRGPALYAATLSMATFSYLFGPPSGIFSGEQPGLLVAFAAMVIIGLLVSTLAVRLRRQVEAAFQREARTAALHGVSRDLATTRGIDNLLGIAAKHGAEVFGCPITILLPGDDGKLAACGGDRARCQPGTPDAVAAQWAFVHGKPAGAGTDTLKRVDALHVPLMASRGTVGVLSLFVSHPRQVSDPERRYLVESFAHHVALAVECDNLAVRAQAVQVEVETERLRNALLSSVSHDLRTPLAAITGAASSLVEHDGLLDQRARQDLAVTIHEESDHLARLVSNLLDMTRLEGGGLHLQLAPHALEDVVGVALRVLDRRLKGRQILARVPPDCPPVMLDGLLIQEVLVNLVDNAVKYTPADRAIEIGAEAGSDQVTVAVRDHGLGLASDELERVFEKFYRGSAQGHHPGVGLGLSICKGIVEAHGGRIWAANASDGGAVFRFTLKAARLPEPAATAVAAPAILPVAGAPVAVDAPGPTAPPSTNAP
jgi:two-component system, OmpR family, sensor histidine kinase KdpD